MDKSNVELHQLLKTLELLQMDEEDVRYDIFSIIYKMLFDNIQLRLQLNKSSQRILNLSQVKIDTTVSGYFRKEHKTINSLV